MASAYRIGVRRKHDNFVCSHTTCHNSLPVDGTKLRTLEGGKILINNNVGRWMMVVVGSIRLSSLVGAVAHRLKYCLYWERSGLISAAFRHWALSY